MPVGEHTVLFSYQDGASVGVGSCAITAPVYHSQIFTVTTSAAQLKSIFGPPFF
jgi:hypothetical protein